ncbi:hypothetical protein [Ferviditalea candida]|uniref:Uncharacterized protein n=1 Tax=Ferviditalea candida TaxID=3108399 RepID=A0ABU5ZG47_9BACL|nr:hypothetical protein [Paenibacillaceae bacterium T2]
MKKRGILITLALMLSLVGTSAVSAKNTQSLGYNIDPSITGNERAIVAKVMSSLDPEER